METIHQPNLTASELAFLWTSYQNDSMSICIFKHCLANIEDHSIREVLEFAQDIAKKHIQKVTQILEEEQYLLPQGIAEKDVNLDAPRLFTDVFYLQYILNMSELGLTSYSIALSSSSRDDMIDFYSTAMAETVKLHNLAKRLLKEKGLYNRDSGLPSPEKIDFVKNKSFLNGLIGERRPLLGIEYSNIWYDSLRNTLGQALNQAVSQVAENKEVRQYFARGRDILGKHLEMFSSIISKSFLSKGAFVLVGEVTESKVAPFSDKLMMYHLTVFFAAILGQYGISMSCSPRHDIGILNTRLFTEIASYVNDGAKIMIDHGWMEQPPITVNRKKLSQ